MRIVIPSMGRSAIMTTHRIVASATVCVPESQEKIYRAALRHWTGMEVVAHPDSLKGIGPKMNWCFEHLGEERGLIRLDDDLTGVRLCQSCPGEREQTKKDPSWIQEMILGTAATSAELGSYLFGWAVGSSSVIYFDPSSPISLKGFVNGCAVGFGCGHQFQYDPRIVAKHDYDIALMNAYLHRFCFRDQRYCFTQKFVLRGGLGAHRNSITEQNDFAVLRQKYGSGVIGVRKTPGRRSREGIAKISLRLPY